MSQEKKRMGRPPSGNAKDVRFSIRLDRKMEDRLEYYCNIHHISKGEAIRQGIDLLIK